MSGSRPVVLFLDRLFPAIGGMETHGLALRDHLLRGAGLRTVLIWERSPMGHVPETDARLLFGDALEPVLAELSTLERPIVFLNSCHWIEQLEAIRGAAPSGVIVQRTGGNEIFKAPHSDPSLRLHERQQFWVDAINRFVDVLLSNSAFTTQRLAELGVEPDRIRQVSGGIPGRGCAAAERRRLHHRSRIFGGSSAGTSAPPKGIPQKLTCYVIRRPRGAEVVAGYRR